MKVSTRLLLLSAVFVMLIAILGYVMFQTSELINIDVIDSDEAAQIIRDSFELNIVTFEYLSHHEERMEQQWLIKYESLGNFLEDMRAEETHAEDIVKLEVIISDYESLGDFFSLLLSNFDNRKRLIEENGSQAEIDLTLASEERLASQALIRSQRMASEAFKLSEAIQQRIGRVQQRTNSITLASIFVFIAIAFYISFVTIRAITGPLNELVASADKIGKGDLEHRVDIRTRNEIGALAQAFNRMTENLVQDISERKRAEEALRESEARYRNLFENAEVGMYRTILDGSAVLAANQKISEILGIPREEILSNPDFIRWENPADRDEMVGRLKEAGSLRDFEIRLRGAGDEIKTVLLSGNLMPEQGWFDGSVVDITERKQAEEELQRLNLELDKRVIERTAQLEAANRELEAFSYSISHDLRAPLRAMDGFSQALLEDHAEQVDDEGKDHLRRVRSAAHKMAELIEDLLGLSRVARAEMRREKIDLSELAQDIVAELEKSEPERRIELIIREGIVVDGDLGLLRVALGNLMRNAWKFSGERMNARIEFGLEEQDGQRVYFVRDNGAGFDMAYADKLFGPFQRLHAATEFPGTGVGLATVLRIINRHGGQIWAEAEVDQGATFYFTL